MRSFDLLYKMLEDDILNPQIFRQLDIVSCDINEVESDKENLEESIEEFRAKRFRFGS